MSELRIDRDLRYVDIDGRVVLLHLRSEAYHVLDPTASAMWLQTASGRSQDEILCSLEQRFAVDAGRLEADYAAFVRSGIEAGFWCESSARPDVEPTDVEPADVGAAVPARKGFLFWRAWWSLHGAARRLKKQGFYLTYRRCIDAAERVRVTADVDTLLSRAVAAFARAENFYPLQCAPQDCLPRSLALFGFLRSLGLPVEHVIGVQLFPFLAHAWVECRGRVLYDHPANGLRFKSISRIRV